MKFLSSRQKITLTLVALSTSPILLALSAGLIELADNDLLARRQRSTEEMVRKCADRCEQQGVSAMRIAANDALQQTPELRQLRVIRSDGVVLCELTRPAGQERRWERWFKMLDDPQLFQLPVDRQGRPWMTFEATYSPLAPSQSSGGRLLMVIAMILLVNSVSFGVFLRRALSFMSPKNAVPTRVRNTLDTIASGIVLLDSELRILTVNEAFTKSCGKSTAECTGGDLDQFEWKIAEGVTAPWARVAETLQPCIQTVELQKKSDRSQIFNANATPVLDANGGLAGILISFEDVTEIEAQRKSLMSALLELEKNKEQIRRQNETLQELALRDALTGAHNRRALFEFMENCWAQLDRSEKGMVGVMMDVDHFKKLNDVHGHAVGDAVLRDVAKVIKTTLGDAGFFGRYGGEEFSVVLPETSLADGIEVAERIRRAIQTQLAVPYAVTASFGVSTSLAGASSPQLLIDQADKGLYAAKQLGRNQVQTYSEDVEAMVEVQNANTQKVGRIEGYENIPLSYQSAVSLHTALMFHDRAVGLHCQRVADLAVSLGRGLLAVHDLYALEVAALLHDIGHIGAAAVDIQPADRDLIDGMGLQIIESAFRNPLLLNVLRFQDCRFDGREQDAELPRGADIPLSARILAIANRYDELTSGLGGVEPVGPQEAFLQLQLQSGTSFDPELVTRFTALQLGWRIDSSYRMPGMDQPEIIDLGHHLERAMHAFETGNVSALQKQLSIIAVITNIIDMPHIGRIANLILKNLDRKTASDVGVLLPMLNDLIESSNMVLRAHLRSVAIRPKCKQLRPVLSGEAAADPWPASTPDQEQT